MSVARSLVAGHILEEQLFPYPQLREKDQEVLRMMVALRPKASSGWSRSILIQGVRTTWWKRR